MPNEGGRLNTIKRVLGAVAGGGGILFGSSSILQQTGGILTDINKLIVGAIAAWAGLPTSIIATLLKVTGTIAIYRVFGKIITAAVIVGWLVVIMLGLTGAIL